MSAPTLGRGVGGWGPMIGAGLSKVEDENRPQLNSVTTFTEQAGVLTATTWTKSSRSLLALWQSQLGAPSNGFLRFLPRQLAVFGLAHRVRFIVSSSR